MAVRHHLLTLSERHLETASNENSPTSILEDIVGGERGRKRTQGEGLAVAIRAREGEIYLNESDAARHQSII